VTNILTYHSTELIVPVKGFTAQVHEKEYVIVLFFIFVLTNPLLLPVCSTKAYAKPQL